MCIFGELFLKGESNIQMKKVLYYVTQLILFISFWLNCFPIANIMVSRKYEADDGCISGITGENLCIQQTVWIAICILIVVLMIVLGYNKKRIIKK